MLKILNRKNNPESGVALVISVIIVAILLSVATAVAVATMSSLQNSSTYRDATYYEASIETALSDLVEYANNPANANKIGEISPHTPRTGKVPSDVDINYEWYVSEYSNRFSDLSYEFTVTVWRGSKDDGNVRRVKGFLLSTPTEGAVYVKDKIYYSPTKESIFGFGVFGGRSLTVGESTHPHSTIKITNSAEDDYIKISPNGGTDNRLVTTAENADSIGSLKVGTNEEFNITRIQTTNPYNSLIPTKTPSYNINLFANANCDQDILNQPGEICAKPRKTEAGYGINVSIINEWVNEQCQGVTLENITATDIVTLQPGANCFGDIVTSGDNMRLADTVSSGNPALVYVNGSFKYDINLNMTSFNYSKTTKTSPLAARFYITGDATFGTERVTSANSTPVQYPDSIAQGLFAASGNCTLTSQGTSNIPFTLVGALVCGGDTKIGRTTVGESNQSESVVVVDEQAKQISSSRKSPTCEVNLVDDSVYPIGTNDCVHRIWEVVNVTNVPYGE